MIAQLIYARILYPCSKSKTASTVFPYLYHGVPISEDQIYDGCAFIGESYKKYIELFNHCYEEHYKRNFSSVFFDCTNYYFEIDFPKEDKQKEPSKENRLGPIIGRPCFWMRIWFHLRCRCIQEMSQRNRISGRSYRK